MRLVHIRPTHYTYHREGPPPRLRLQSDEAQPYVRLEFAGAAQLFAPANQGQRTDNNYFDSWAGGSGVAGQQLRLSNNKLTYDIPLAVWRRLGQNNHHIFYRATATTQQPPNWNGQPPTTVRTVDDERAARGWAPYFGVPHDQLHDPWVFPDMEPFRQVPDFYRAKLELLTRYHETSEDAYLLRRLAGHEHYTALPVGQRMKALYLFAATNRPARRGLLQLFSRLIPATTAGAAATPAVRSTDLSQQRNTLLDNLARLVEIDPHMEIPETMDTVIADVLEEVADPHYELNQGVKGTCVPTSVQWIIATFIPAEYVRLLLTLLTQEMRTTLANGNAATVPADTYQYNPDEDSTQVRRFLHRSWSERIFQATMMGYARPGLTYSNVRDVFTDQRGGLTMPELVRLISGLRNRPYVNQQGAGANLVSTITQRLQAGSMPILTTVVWGNADTNGNRGSHEVVSITADANNVTFRNPWGGMDYRVGQQLQNPPRSTTNPSRAEETISTANLASWITDIVVEQD